MSAKKPVLSTWSESERESARLESLLAERPAPGESAAEHVSVDEARQSSSMYEVRSSRNATRILFISRDTSLLNPTLQTLDGFLNVSDVFDEVHIVVLRPGIRPKDPVLRVAHNVWVYIAAAENWWWTPVAARELVHSQLVFADGFRPDLIVARDPYESALVAYWIGKRYERPTQLHIMEDFTDPRFRKAEAANWWRTYWARFLVPKFASIRTGGERLKLLAERWCPDAPDLAALPRFHNYEALRVASPEFSLKERYHQYVFIMLYVGDLGHDSTLHRAIDAARFVLRNPRVGMVVVGDGPARGEFMKRTEKFGIAEQVVFIKDAPDLTSFLKTADVLMVTDTNAVADEVVIQGAVAGVPMIMTPTPLRSDLFTDMESALITPNEEIPELSKKLSYFLNDVTIRQPLQAAAAEIVADRLHEDPELYRRAYRDSVEQGMFVGVYGAPTTEAPLASPTS